MADPTEVQLARRAAAAAEARPAFLAAVLARFRELEGLDDEGLAGWLGLAPDQLPWLALCRRPRADAFRDDLFAIADRFGIAPDRLATAIRQVDAFTALAQAPGRNTGLLAAARDDDEDEE